MSSRFIHVREHISILFYFLHISVQIPAFTSLGYIPRSRITGLSINFMFCFFFLKNHHSVLDNCILKVKLSRLLRGWYYELREREEIIMISQGFCFYNRRILVWYTGLRALGIRGFCCLCWISKGLFRTYIYIYYSC